MKILSIETSCDDTGIAILEITGSKKPRFNVSANIVASQVEIHKKFGGVYPALAKREHQRNLTAVLKEALEKAKILNKTQNAKRKTQNHNLKLKTLKTILEREPQLLKQFLRFIKKYQKPKIDAIAITTGPGLEPCLWVGINFAKALSCYWNLPIIPVNHIEAHILVNLLDAKYKILNTKYLFPAICLVVSGGHTQLILIKKIGSYKIVGETRDDAAGECFDKIARILGLPYPGGPEIAAKARTYRGPTSVSLPRPMINSNDFDFSFSGLKTAVLYLHKKLYPKIKNLPAGRQEYIREMCAETQQAIIDVLIKKTLKATKKYNVKTIILGGGVAANEELRKQFKLKIENCPPASPCEARRAGKLKIDFLVPPKNLCTDNAAMVALTGYFHLNKKTRDWKKLKADGNLKI